MVRTCFCLLAAFALTATGIGRADDAKANAGKDKHHMQATIAKIDANKNTVTVKTMDKNGKQEEKTLQLASDAKFVNANGKDVKSDSFKTGDDVCITQKDNKVTELKKHAEAKITKVDAKAGTVTVKMTDQDGKTSERTFRLVEDSEYIDSTGRVAVLDVFKSGDEILFVEADGKVQAMKKAAHKQTTTGSKDDDSKDKSKSSNN